MFLSVFDIFKIGVGPSSSHTMGPMSACARFLEALKHGQNFEPGAGAPASLKATLYGSLAFTGKGHATDRAIILGFCGLTPATLDPSQTARLEAMVLETGQVTPPGLPSLRFAPDTDLIFDYGPSLPGHANGMVLQAFDAAGHLALQETYYSIGGGFVVTEAELSSEQAAGAAHRDDDPCVPHPFASAAEMLTMAKQSGKSIAQMKWDNEASNGDAASVRARLGDVARVMRQCIERGLSEEGILPGGLQVKRRAKRIHEQLLNEAGQNIVQPHTINDWLSVYAMAVNEENAAGGQVVTAPTNGAAGVVPAVLRYYETKCIGATEQGALDFLMVAAAVGGIIKHNASISGAEMGCQGEVGSAAAMAAAGLCAALGGSNAQIENAAEIALEHHLGMTCDPAGGLVQVPCIERNGLGAIKAVSAASLALRGDGSHFMPLDNCIEAMRQTGIDMSNRYKETSQGGLAVNLPEC